MQDILAGLRIIDSTTAVAMPTAMHIMADLGAEIIKVESHTLTRDETGPYADNDPGDEPWNRDASFQHLHRGKYSLTLNLKTAEGIQAYMDLARVTDVIVENNRAGTMDRLGLGYSELRKLKPDMIYFSNTGFGHTGPWKRYAGIGSMLELICGLSQFTGYPDEGTPRRVGAAWFDLHVAWMAVFAIMAALHYRNETGKGQWVDFAMYQIGVSTLGDALLDYSINGRNGRLMGNRHPVHAPYGVYRCQGVDKWIAIGIEADEQWNSLGSVLGKGLSDNPKFGDSLSRKHHEDELDDYISEWAKDKNADGIMEILQEIGVPAYPVKNTKELLTDSHMEARNFYERFVHPSESGIGTRAYVGRPWRMPEMPSVIHRPAPKLGEQNEHIISDLLGWSDEEVSRLYALDIMGKVPSNAFERKPVNLGAGVEEGTIAEIDPDFKETLRYQ